MEVSIFSSACYGLQVKQDLSTVQFGVWPTEMVHKRARLRSLPHTTEVLTESWLQGVFSTSNMVCHIRSL